MTDGRLINRANAIPLVDKNRHRQCVQEIGNKSSHGEQSLSNRSIRISSVYPFPADIYSTSSIFTSLCAGMIKK
jgi:hypothetical protein